MSQLSVCGKLAAIPLVVAVPALQEIVVALDMPAVMPEMCIRDRVYRENDPEEMPIGPPMTMFVVFIWIIPPPPVVVMFPSATTVPLESLTRAHEAVPVASADESEVTAFRVSTPADTVPHGSENVSVPSKTCDVTAVAGSAGIVPV